MAHDSEMSVRGQFVLLSIRFELIAVIYHTSTPFDATALARYDTHPPGLFIVLIWG